MSEFKAFYSKYRPQDFSDVLGQDHIVSLLRESIKTNKISHAYIFSGGRGTGKTSVARIFAREIGTSKDDLYEIDAASNNSVEEIRLLNDSVSVLPFSSKYKVYILDEAHMLSRSAFNALLKTLEEPPSHVIFILATTEIHKIPETIISRCETHVFKKPIQKILKEMILKTAKKEGVSIDDSSADLIALLGDGSFRDTHGILQKVINFSSDKKISIDEVEKVTGSPKSELVNTLIESICNLNLDVALQVIDRAVKQNIDMKVFISLIISKLRLILIFRYSQTSINQYEEIYSKSDIDLILKWSKSENISSRTLSKFLEAFNLINYSYLPQIPLEIAIIEVINHE